MMLFKNKKFSEGVEALLEYNKFIQELLCIYMEKREYEKIINLCKNFGNNDNSFWWISLDFFINKEYRINLNEEEICILNKYLEEFLLKLLESGAMLPINILDIINEKYNDISFNILNTFLNKAIEKEISSIEEQKKKYNEYDKQLNEILGEITDLETKAYIVNLNKCIECGMPMNLPFVCFKCGHGFHNFCLGANTTIKLGCRKCKNKKNKVSEALNTNKNFYNSINTLDKLEKELDKNKDKIDFIHELYGKGLFNIGPIKDNKYEKLKEKE